MREESFYLVPITSISKRRSVHAKILNWINNNAYHIELLSRLNTFNMFVFAGRILYKALDEWGAEVNLLPLGWGRMIDAMQIMYMPLEAYMKRVEPKCPRP